MEQAFKKFEKFLIKKRGPLSSYIEIRVIPNGVTGWIISDNYYKLESFGETIEEAINQAIEDIKKITE